MNKSKNTIRKRLFPRAALAATFGLLAAGIPMLALAQSSSPWLPIPGGGSVGLSYSTQRADTAYIGDKNLPISGITGGGAQRYNRTAYGLSAAYGLTDSVSLDASIGGWLGQDRCRRQFQRPDRHRARCQLARAG